MIEAAGRYLGFETKQKEATVEFVSSDILLPTSYGKSVYTVHIWSAKRKYCKCIK